MKAQDLLKKFYKGDELKPQEPVVGHKPEHDLDMICDCGGDGECCGY
jgi:hypothetical protein